MPYNDAIGYDALILYNGTAAPIPPAPSAAVGSGLMRRYTPIIPHDNRQRAAILEALEDEW